MTYQSVNPATGEIVKTYTSHDQQKIDHSLDQAQALLKPTGHGLRIYRSA